MFYRVTLKPLMTCLRHLEVLGSSKCFLCHLICSQALGAYEVRQKEFRRSRLNIRSVLLSFLCLFQTKQSWSQAPEASCHRVSRREPARGRMDVPPGRRENSFTNKFLKCFLVLLKLPLLV